jgi:hypothetical protein
MIHLPRSPQNLLNPMQMRLNDSVMNEIPKFQCVKPTDLLHTNFVKGVSFLPTRKPTQEEFHICERYDIPYESHVYDHSGPLYAEQEAAMTDSRG